MRAKAHALVFIVSCIRSCGFLSSTDSQYVRIDEKTLDTNKIRHFGFYRIILFFFYGNPKGLIKFPLGSPGVPPGGSRGGGAPLVGSLGGEALQRAVTQAISVHNLHTVV